MKALVWAALAAALPAVQAAGDPADPAAPVPRTEYRSVFQDTPTGLAEDAADWKKANAEVGQFLRGHVDLLKWEGRQPDQPAPATSPSAPPAAGHKH